MMTEDAGGTWLLSPSLIFLLGSGNHCVLSTGETEAGTESLESPEGTQNWGFPARGRVAGS